MGDDLRHAEIIEFLGVYALDAVDVERQEIAHHLEGCVRCRREVAEHREVAAVLSSGWSPAPEGLWDRIAGSLEETPPPLRMPAERLDRPVTTAPFGPASAPPDSPPTVSLDAERRRRRPLAWTGKALAAIAVAASIAVATLVGVDVLRPDTGPADVAELAAAAADHPDARRVAMRSTDGTLTADAVVLSGGTGYVLESNLPELPPDRTYQLWAVVGTRTVSVGVLGRSVEPLAFRAAGDVSGFAITNETAGGVLVSQQQPTVIGTVV